jgi:PrcB C-terminal
MVLRMGCPLMVLLAACGGMAGGGGGGQPLAGDPVVATPLPVTGLAAWNTALLRRERLVVRSRAEWEALWARLQARLDPAPAVDFAREMLLVAALGERPSGGYRVSIPAVAQDGALLRAEVLEIRPGRGCMTTMAVTTPVAVVRVPRSEAPVEFVERTETRDCE